MSAGDPDPAGLEALTGAGPAASAHDVVAALRMRDDPPTGRPRVVAAMIASLDGRAAVEGRSVALGHPADRALLRTLRAAADAVLVGPGTVRAERYANLIDPDLAASRVAEGRPPSPIVATVTRSGDVPWEVGLFEEPDSRVTVYTGTAVEPPATVTTPVEVITGTTELSAVLVDLRVRHDVRGVLCEGGPTLLRALAAADLLDDLFLTVAPMLVAGSGPTALSGPVLDPPDRLALEAVHRADDHLVLHYRRVR